MAYLGMDPDPHPALTVHRKSKHDENYYPYRKLKRNENYEHFVGTLTFSFLKKTRSH